MKMRHLLAEYESLNLLCVLLLQFMLFFQVKSESQSSPTASDLASSQDAVGGFQPSLAVVIGILSIMLSLTFILLLYAKFCRNSNSSGSVHNHHILDGLPRSRSRFSGIDKTVIESLPLFRFSSLKGSREGLECSICLSRFEDIEILRLLPKCKHAFHINCLDQWLEKHSSCPLCRFKVSPDDLSTFTYSNSLRFLWNQQELTQESSNLELYIQREESQRGFSRFSNITESFRKSEKDKKEDELPIQQQCDDDMNEKGKVLHKFNHEIIVSDAVLMKNRWSNVSSSDLMFLKSEMLNEESGCRFSALESSYDGSKQCISTPTKRKIGGGEVMNIKEEMERKREFEIKLSKIQQNESFLPPLTNLSKPSNSDSKRDATICTSQVLNPSEKRSMSEIVVHPRFSTEFEINPRINCEDNNREGNLTEENSGKEEKMRRLWLPIARRTVQWFANRERSSTQQPQHRRESLNV